jgi:hypothetical protein
MAPLTIACDDSGHTTPGAAPISATTATDILVRERITDVDPGNKTDARAFPRAGATIMS